MVRRLRLVDIEDGLTRPIKGGHMRSRLCHRGSQSRDAHFASAPTFLFYDVGPDSHSFVEAVQFDAVSNQDGQHSEDG